MKKELFGVVWIEGLIAFLTPFAAAAVPTIATWAAVGAPPPNRWAIVGVSLVALIAGASGLKSFLSTAVSDAKYDIAVQNHLDSQPLLVAQSVKPASADTIKPV